MVEWIRHLLESRTPHPSIPSPEGWQGQTTLTVGRTTSRSFKCLGRRASRSLPLLPGKDKGKVCWSQRVVGFQATIIRPVELSRALPLPPLDKWIGVSGHAFSLV